MEKFCFNFYLLTKIKHIKSKFFLDNNSVPPSAYPYGFALNNTRYLLFGYGHGIFKLYKYDSEDTNHVYFKTCNLWDFSNIPSGINITNYTLDGGPWVLCPTYNDANQNLYFTLVWKVINPSYPNDSSKNFVRVRLFKASLSNSVFGNPIQISGPINPTDASQWIGRMYLTQNGTKAFFNALNICDQSLIKNGDPYLAPTPNSQTSGPYTDPSMIWTYILSADVVNGTFTNIHQLSSSINTSGINYVCGVSDDGNSLYLAHMDIGADFWNTYGSTTWRPDGLTLRCCFEAPYNVAPWNGTISIVPSN